MTVDDLVIRTRAYYYKRQGDDTKFFESSYHAAEHRIGDGTTRFVVRRNPPTGNEFDVLVQSEGMDAWDLLADDLDKREWRYLTDGWV